MRVKPGPSLLSSHSAPTAACRLGTRPSWCPENRTKTYTYTYR